MRKTAFLHSIIAMAAMAGASFQSGFRTTRMMGLADAGGHVESARNGGGRGGNRAIQRAAVKRRNVIKHRKACRG